MESFNQLIKQGGPDLAQSIFSSVDIGNTEPHLAFILSGGFVGGMAESPTTAEFSLSPARLATLVGHQTALTDLLGLQ